jgi:hypothetical protein
MSSNEIMPLLKQLGFPVVIALISGGVAMTGTTAVLSEQLSQCKANIERIERTLEQMHRDMYRPHWPSS